MNTQLIRITGKSPKTGTKFVWNDGRREENFEVVPCPERWKYDHTYSDTTKVVWGKSLDNPGMSPLVFDMDRYHIYYRHLNTEILLENYEIE